MGNHSLGKESLPDDAVLKARRAVAKSVIDGLGGLRFVRDAITNAPRLEIDAAGRQWPIGPNVAAMATALLSWEGHGELPDFWLHKVREDWYDADAQLTERRVRGARKLGVAEGLWEEAEGRRPSDGTRTTFYRLDIVRVGLAACRSEAASTERLIDREKRPRKLDEHKERINELERAKATLVALEDGADSPQP